MHVVHDGAPDAPPLLLIHGSGASGATWAPVVPALGDSHHVIRVDLPGCGQSPPAPSYDVPAQAESVEALLDALGGPPPVVVGHSSGGYVATALAERRPDLVRSLALVSTGPSPDALLPQPLVRRAMLAPPIGSLVWRLRSDAMIRQGIAAICARHIDVDADVGADMVADLRRLSYRTMRSVLQHNTAYIARRSVPDRLAELDVPVLVLFGSADPRWDPASAHQYDVVPDASVDVLPGVGHFPMLEAPGEVSTRLLAFTELHRG